MRTVLLFATAAALTACANASTDALSDAALIARTNAVMGVKEAPVDRMLGVHKGAPVIVDVRCGDICPQYTVRIVHYTLDTGPACAKIGGDTAMIAVPAGIGVITQKFCIPHVLFRRKLYNDHPYQQ